MNVQQVTIGLPDLRRKSFESWFTALFLKYDEILVSNRWDTKKAFKEKLATLSNNVKDVVAINWSKFRSNYENLEYFDCIKWTDDHYKRLVEVPNLAVHVLEREDALYNRLQKQELFELPFSRDTLLKLESTILTTNVTHGNRSYDNPIDTLLECKFRATDLTQFISDNPYTSHPLIRREVCPLDLVQHAYSVANEKNSVPIYFSILLNPSGEAKLKEMRVDIINNHNYEVLSLCVASMQKHDYYESIKKCAEQHGLVLKVEES